MLPPKPPAVPRPGESPPQPPAVPPRREVLPPPPAPPGPATAEQLSEQLELLYHQHSLELAESLTREAALRCQLERAMMGQEGSSNVAP